MSKVREDKNLIVGLDIGTSKIVTIVAELLPEGSLKVPQAAECVVGATVGVKHGASGIGNILGGAVAHRIEGVAEAAAVLLNNRGEAVGGVVFIVDVAGVGAGEFDELADVVVIELGGLSADDAAGEPAARAVGEGGDEGVGVGGLGYAAVGVVFVIGGDMAEGVGDLFDLAATAERGRTDTASVGGVVVGGGDIGHVNARAVVDGLDEYAGEGGVIGGGGGPGAGFSGGEVFDAAAGERAAGVVDGAGLASSFGHCYRQTQAWVPGGEDFTLGGADSRSIRSQIGGACEPGCQAFDARGFEVAG